MSSTTASVLAWAAAQLTVKTPRGGIHMKKILLYCGIACLMVPGIASADLATCQADFNTLLGQYVTDSTANENPAIQAVCVSTQGSPEVQALSAMLVCEEDLVFDARFVKGAMGAKSCQITIYIRCKSLMNPEVQLTSDLAGSEASKWKQFLKDEDPGGGCNAVQSLL
jgi:hypothetical protein